MDLQIIKSTLIGLGAIGAVYLHTHHGVTARVQGVTEAALSEYNLAKVGHAALVYAADHDDVLPFAAGNYAYSQAQKTDKGCAAIGPEFAGGCEPVNSLTQGYGTDWVTYRSAADHGSGNQGDPATWYESTATKGYAGASFDYFWHPAYAQKPVSEFEDAKSQPIFVSMFPIDTEEGKMYQVAYMDGHLGKRSRASLEFQPEPK